MDSKQIAEIEARAEAATHEISVSQFYKIVWQLIHHDIPAFCAAYREQEKRIAELEARPIRKIRRVERVPFNIEED